MVLPFVVTSAPEQTREDQGEPGEVGANPTRSSISLVRLVKAAVVNFVHPCRSDRCGCCDAAEREGLGT
jgi:hypothetical protein